LPLSLISIKTKKHKSLGVLTLIFIRLFLSKNKILSLEEATETIFDQCERGQTLFKSKVAIYSSSFNRVEDYMTLQM